MAPSVPFERSKPTVVVAEDNRETRELIQAFLVGAGYEVHAFDNGEAALERVQNGGIDLCLFDIKMPGPSGLDCCRIVKGMTDVSFLPVILVTGRTDVDSRVGGLRAGADDYVCKPFDERELLARVENLVRMKRLHDEIWEAKHRLEQLAVRDEMTGLYNYRYLQTRLSEEFKRAERYRDPLSCVMVDIDHFKRFNDSHGHDVGDAVLREVASRLRAGVREIDVVARYGGEEFLLILPSTHFAGAITVAERILEAVRAEPVVVAGRFHQVRVSAGIACFPTRDVQGKDDLVRAADRALYYAKEQGRDGLAVYRHEADVRLRRDFVDEDFISRTPSHRPSGAERPAP